MTDRMCQSSLQSFVLEISRWTMLHGQVEQMKLIAIQSKHGEQSMSYHIGESPHTQNMQIDKVIGENEKCVFDFTEKTIWTFWPMQYL